MSTSHTAPTLPPLARMPTLSRTPLAHQAPPASQVAPPSAPAAHVANAAPTLPPGTISVSGTDGDLQATKSGEFDKSPTAPLTIEKLNEIAFPAPQTKFTDNDFLNSLFDAASKAIAKRSKMDASSVALQLIESTAATSVAALPPEAIKLFFTCMNLGFGVDTSYVKEVKSDVVKKAQAESEFDDLLGDMDLESLTDMEDDIPF